jgi:hypothetical protein
MLRTLIAMFMFGAAFAQDTCGCGLAGAACCSCEFRPRNELCLFYEKARWCEPGLECDGVACYKPDLQVQSLGPCGAVGELCCPSGWCAAGLTCSNEACVDPNGVVDSSPCGYKGAPCCGLTLDCDEDLLCESGTCTAQVP